MKKMFYLVIIVLLTTIVQPPPLFAAPGAIMSNVRTGVGMVFLEDFHNIWERQKTPKTNSPPIIAIIQDVILDNGDIIVFLQVRKKIVYVKMFFPNAKEKKIKKEAAIAVSMAMKSLK